MASTMLGTTLSRTLHDPLQALFLAVFLLSTPLTAIIVFGLGAGKDEPAESRNFWVRT